jgi:hypothetical protein
VRQEHVFLRAQGAHGHRTSRDRRAELSQILCLLRFLLFKMRMIWLQPKAAQILRSSSSIRTFSPMTSNPASSGSKAATLRTSRWSILP